MKRLKAFFSSSASELRNLRSLTLASFLVAIYAVSYSPVAGNFIIAPGLVEIRFGYLAVAAAALMFGPVVAALVAVLGDLLGSVLFYGGSFAFGYTAVWAVMGFGFGCFLYRMKTTLPRLAGAAAFYAVVVRGVLTPLLQSLLGYGPFAALFVSRLPLNLVMFPVNTILLVLVLRGVSAVYSRMARAAP